MRRFWIVLLALVMLMGSALTVSAQDEQTRYTVRYGDTLYRISLNYGVNLYEIARVNNIPNVNLIYVGQVLIIPTPGTTPPDPTPEPTDPAPTPEPGEIINYTVVRGDYLSRIARQFGTTVTAIAQLNNIVNINLIYTGQVLRIPVGQTTPPPTTPTPSPTPDGGGSNPPPVTGGFELGGQILTGNFSNASLMQQTGMTWVKVQVRWNGSDPASNVANLINDAHNNGFKILLGVVGDKSQISTNPTQYYQNFANYVGELAALGADGIEVWNEPNIDKEWPVGLIGGSQYTQMLSAAYQAIKSRNGATLVVSGAPAPTQFFGGCSGAGCDDNLFISSMAQAGAGNFADCIGIHYNAGAVPPTATSGAPVQSASSYTWYYPSMVNVYRNAFPGKQLCFTEIGYLSGEGWGELPGAFGWASGTSIQEHAQWIAQAAQLARNGGYTRLFIVWNVDSTTFGADPQAGYALIRKDNSCPGCNTLKAALGN